MLKIKTFKQFAREFLKVEILNDIRYLKAVKDSEQDAIYIFFKNHCKKLYTDRQAGNFKRYKRIFADYKNYIKNKDIKQGITIKEYNKAVA